MTPQGTRARKHMSDSSKEPCKGRDNLGDASEAALQGRQQREGGNLCCIVVVDATYITINIIRHNLFFSSLIDVDLSHSMLVDCSMICFRECCPL